MEFFASLKTYLNDEEIVKLRDSLEKENRHAVLLNPKKMSDEQFLSLFPNVQKHPIVKHAFLYKKEEYDLGKSVYHTFGCFYLQEPSAMVPAYLLDVQEDEIVLDMCAAPGGKTIQTSFLMKDTGLIVSNDLSRSRASIIVENEERLGLGNIVVTSNDISKIYKQHLNKFDRIILDAPCSGSGMFRKEEKMRDDWSYSKVLKFAEVQKELVLIAYEMLKPGGTLCYSTCSFSEEEDEQVIEYLLQNTDAEVKNISNDLFYINKKKPLGFHLLPSIFPGEGHYVCLIKKPGNSVIKREKETVKSNKYGLEFKNIYKFSNVLFGLNSTIDLKGFNIVRMGVKIGELFGEEIRYDYHYAHYTNRLGKFELDDNSLKLYFNGNTLPTNLQKNYYLLLYKGFNVDIAKSDGRQIKNHFPKAFRHKI